MLFGARQIIRTSVFACGSALQQNRASESVRNPEHSAITKNSAGCNTIHSICSTTRNEKAHRPLNSICHQEPLCAIAFVAFVVPPFIQKLTEPMLHQHKTHTLQTATLKYFNVQKFCFQGMAHLAVRATICNTG